LRVTLALTLIAFIAQSFAVQTHIHLESVAEAAVVDKSAAAQKTAPDIHGQDPQADRQGKTAPADDSANCPLCQEYLYAGSYVTPAAIAILPPVLAVSTVPVEIREMSPVWAISHSWQGRAPPFV
jgi:hypothetical protein